MEHSKPGNDDIIGALVDQIGTRLDADRAKKEEIPAVYKSGMRGDEDPPAVRKRKEAEAKLAAAKKGMRPGVDPDKVNKTQKGRVQDEGGKRKKVEFEAGETKKALKKRVADLEKQIAELKTKKRTLTI